jgi:hypothetical protein
VSWAAFANGSAIQCIDHPGYNLDRGPVLVGMLRLHVDF